MKITKKNLSVVLLMSAVCLSLGANFGFFGGGKAIEIRLEDILIVFLGIIFIFQFLYFKKGKIEKPLLLLPILFWLGVGLVSLLINLMLNRLAIDRGLFYYFKQVEFFVIYFYVFWQIKDIKSAKFLLNWFLFLGVANAGYVIYQVITGNRMGEYGTAAICERGVFPTGSFFMLFSIISINIFLHYYYYLKINIFKKIGLGLIMITPALGVFGSDSKTVFLIFMGSMALTVALLFLKQRNFKLLFVIALVFVVMVLAFLLGQKYIPFSYRLLQMFSLEGIATGFYHGRWVFILKVIQEAFKYPSMAFLGFGPGYVGEAHNQFLRNYMEVGLIGSTAFFLLIFYIIRISFKAFIHSRDKFLTAVSSSLLVCTIASFLTSFVTDTFIVVKPSEIYWMFTALALAVVKLSLDKKDGSAVELFEKQPMAISAPQKNNISAVIIVHDPEPDFIENLKITSEQVDRVIVVNNGSLKINQNLFDNSGLSEKIVLISNQENLGQGKALNQGVNYCKDLGYKWVLLLDQDSKIDSKMVENQIEAYSSFPSKNLLAIVGANCIFQGTGEIKYAPKNQKKYFKRDVVMASGTLLSLQMFLETGQFREEFFIDSIDADYCLRLRKKGFKIIVAYNAMMLQRVGNQGIMKRFLWKKILVTNHTAKRCYYMTRNGLILVKEYLFFEPYWCLRRVAWYFFVKPLFVLFYEKDKKEKIKNIIKGVFSAFLF